MSLPYAYATVLARSKEGVTQTEIAVELGVSQSRVSQIYNTLAERFDELGSERYAQRKACDDTTAGAQVKRDIETARLSDSDSAWIRSLSYYAQLVQRGQLLPFTLLPSDVFPIPDTCPISGMPISTVHVKTGKKGDRGVSAGHVRVDPSIGYAAGNIIVVHRTVAEMYRCTTVMEVARTSAALLKLARNQPTPKGPASCT